MGSIDNHRLIAAALRPTLKRVSSAGKLTVAGDFICGGSVWAIHKDIASSFLQNIYNDLPVHNDAEDILANLGSLTKRQSLSITDMVRVLANGTVAVVLEGENPEDMVYVDAYFLGLFAADTPELFRVSWANIGMFDDTGEVVGIIGRLRIG